MTDVSIQKRVQRGRTLTAEYHKLDSYDKLMTWEKGRILNQLKTSRDYKFVSGSHTENVNDSWAAFVREELDEPVSTVEYRIALYRKWVLELGFKPKEICDVNTRKLHRAIPFLTKGNAQEVLEHARSIIGFGSFVEWLKETYA